MLTLGFSGGLNRVHENPFDLPGAFSHDGAAVIVRDGEVIAAIEEERLNRIKHSNKFPTQSIRFCLDAAGASLADVDRIAFYATEEYCDSLLAGIYLDRPEVKEPLKARKLMRLLLAQEFGTDVPSEKIVFVPHHIAHAVSAHNMSGFDESLIVAIDGYGDFLSGIVAHGRGHDVTLQETFPQSDSLGLFYLEVIQFVGYGPFDEYKVMGLAPYGDPSRYRDLLAQCYELLPNGNYRMHLDRVAPLLLEHIQVRKKGDTFTQQHKDLSASLQEALETIAFHIIRPRRETSGLRNLCLAGGVAHNCTMNGKLLYSGLFDDVFVQPAAHDAGCALGAALFVSQQLGKPAPRRRLQHVYWGRDLGNEASMERELGSWERMLSFQRTDDVAREAAELMAGGAVVAWTQGRSEFGPRALGNRSILADPRPAENKDRINQMVKKREGYRPFAPSALEEDAREFFDLPEQGSYPFMIFVVRVREDKRALLGAITHVDGTARLHTVSRETNPAYWAVINEFKKLTGVSVLLNTSFNNNAEPIVDSALDAVTTFLTTGLDYLALGPYLAKKRPLSTADWLSLHLSLPPYTQLHQTRASVDGRRRETKYELRTTYTAKVRVPVSKDVFAMAMMLDGDAPSIAELLTACSVPVDRWESVIAELGELWAARMVTLRALPAHEQTKQPAPSAAAQGASWT